MLSTDAIHNTAVWLLPSANSIGQTQKSTGKHRKSTVSLLRTLLLNRLVAAVGQILI